MLHLMVDEVTDRI